jgi:hypothetical protein
MVMDVRFSTSEKKSTLLFLNQSDLFGLEECFLDVGNQAKNMNKRIRTESENKNNKKNM